MIWITGDKHGQLEAFNDNSNFKKIKRGDTLIVCGDFGFVWDNSTEEKKNLKKLSKKNFTIAFVDGCHENFALLEGYPEQDWNGGKVRKITNNIVWLLRGESYNIDGKKVLAFGGGKSVHDDDLDPDFKWYEAQLPSDKQVDNVIEKINQNQGEFDIIISHEPPLSVKYCLEEKSAEPSDVNNILEEIRKHTTCKAWFFGNNHIDKVIPPFYRAVFNDIVKITELDYPIKK